MKLNHLNKAHIPRNPTVNTTKASTAIRRIAKNKLGILDMSILVLHFLFIVQSLSVRFTI